MESPFTASTAFTFTNRCVVVPDNSANDEIGPGAGDKPLNSNGDADPNAGEVVSSSAGNAPSGTSGGVSVSTIAKMGDATLTLAVVLAAVVGLAMAIAGLACGKGRNHKKKHAQKEQCRQMKLQAAGRWSNPAACFALLAHV